MPLCGISSDPRLQSTSQMGMISPLHPLHFHPLQIFTSMGNNSNMCKSWTYGVYMRLQFAPAIVKQAASVYISVQFGFLFSGNWVLCWEATIFP